MDEQYVHQVRLLLHILPDIAAEDVFALKGGTAINLFYREMPRLSVDIDLAYLPVEEREKSLQDIDETLIESWRRSVNAIQEWRHSEFLEEATTTRESWSGRVRYGSRSRPHR